jgi:type IV pilus assembly protein PilB
MSGKLKLGQILVSKGLIGPEQLASALGEQQRWGGQLGMTLVRMGFLEEEILVRTLASQLHLPVARIRGKQVDSEVLDQVSVELAEKYRCLPLFAREEGGAEVLVLGMEDPTDLQALDDLSFRLGQKVRPVLVAPTELEEALHRHYHWTGPVQDALPLPVDPAPASDTDGTAIELPSLDEAAATFDPDRSSEAVEPSRKRDADGTASVESRVILRALSQLLVEKGVISRDEFVERLRRVRAEEEGEPD